MLERLNEKDNFVENQSMIRALIDFQFHDIKHMYYIFMVSYLLLFFIPFGMYCNYLAHYNAINNKYENPWEDFQSNNPDMDALVTAVWEHEAAEHREAVCPPEFPKSFPKDTLLRGKGRDSISYGIGP